MFGNNAQETGQPPSVWRYYLISQRPESSDSAFLWANFISANNNELLANLGNFVNRVSLSCKGRERLLRTRLGHQIRKRKVRLDRTRARRLRRWRAVQVALLIDTGIRGRRQLCQRRQCSALGVQRLDGGHETSSWSRCSYVHLIQG